MARDTQSPIPTTTLIALVLGLGGFIAIDKSSFLETRPPEQPTATYWHSPAVSQDIEARLWDDPLAAIARVRRVQEHADHEHEFDRFATLTRRATPDVAVMGAMVSGAPYAEDIERRRRTRYAVIAGLHRVGFVPESPDHVGYFMWSPKQADDLRMRRAIAYEWLGAEQPNASRREVLLLWLDQDAFREHPLRDFEALVNAVAQAMGRVEGKGQNAADPNFQALLLGPADSDALRSMWREFEDCKPGSCRFSPAIKAYSPNATASDGWVTGHSQACIDKKEPPLPTNALAGAMEVASGHTVRLYRTLADDCLVTWELYQDLLERGVREITLVLERDTLYSRLMGEYFGANCEGSNGNSPSGGAETSDLHVGCYTYLRGLDGLVAQPNSTAQPVQQSKPTPDEPSPQAAAGSISQETASGRPQLDYLRRLAKQVASRFRQEPCQHSNLLAPCTRAIGVLGTDVYDKILVLQALRAELPRAVFFTTDFDARLLDPQHLKWTRHLIVGSSYGLTLTPELQGDVAPFRDNYQTAAYLTTMLAFQPQAPAQPPLARNSARIDPDPVADISTAWASSPRVFEIGSADAYELRAHKGETEENGWQDSRTRRAGGCAVLTCKNVAAPPAPAFWDDSSAGTGFEIGVYVTGIIWILMGIAVGFTPSWAFVTAQTSLRKLWSSWLVRSLVASLAFITALTIFWAKLLEGIAPAGTPVPVFGGASIWGALLIEIVSILLVASLMIRGHRRLAENAIEIQEHFGFRWTPAQLIEHRMSRLRSKGSGWKQAVEHVVHLFGIGLAPPPAADAQPLSDVEEILSRYLYRGRWFARGLRVIVATALSTAALVLIDYKVGMVYIEVGVLSPSGVFASTIAAGVSLLSLLCIQFLVFWVADAMLLTTAFTSALKKQRPGWPSEGLKRAGALAVPMGAATVWSNLQLVALRTRCVAGLVWYPSMVIAGMAIASFTVEFGPFSFASNPVCLFVSAIYLFGAAFLLRRAAEALRGACLNTLEDMRSCALAEDVADSKCASQLERLVARTADLSEGAFAPYSQQPLMKAIVFPLVSYGGALALEYLQRAH